MSAAATGMATSGMTTWTRIATLAPRAAAKVVSAADGTFVWTLPAARFAALPIVTGTAEASNGRDHVVTLTAVSVKTVAGQVRRSRPLPAQILSLSSLASFHAFEPAPGVTVDLTAQVAS